MSLDLPFPPDKGQRMRNLSLLRALAAEQHEVSLITFVEPHDLHSDISALHHLCQSVVLVPLPSKNGNGRWRHLHRLWSLGSSIPYGAQRFRSDQLVSAAREHLAQHACDVVIWDEAYNLENLTAPLPVPVVLNSHDIMQIVWGRYLALERNPLKRLYAWLEYRKLCRWEPAAHRRVTKVLAVSRHDAALLEAMCPGLSVAVVPNTVEVNAYALTKNDVGQSVLFVGGIDWFPNRDAVEFFASDILPILRKLVPGVRFTVLGRSASTEVRTRLERAGVEFSGRVPDVRPLIAEAAVCVVPLRIGSGVRWKILEAAAMGKAIVSTQLGAEGLDFEDKREIILVDDPERFARSIATLLTDTTRRRAIGASARQRVEQQYSSATLRRALREALADFDNNRSPVRARP